MQGTSLQVLLGIIHLQELAIGSRDVAEVERSGRRRDITALDCLRVLFDGRGRCHHAWFILVVRVQVIIVLRQG